MTAGSHKTVADRIDWLDVARGGSILLVVLYHTILYLNEIVDLHPAYGALNGVLKPIRMPMFFAISGFLASGAIRRDWRQLLSQRILLLAYLFVLWSAIYWLYYRYGIPHVRFPEMGGDFGQLVGDLYQPSTAIWFLWALVIYLVIAKAMPQVLRPIVLGLSALLSILFFGGTFQSAFFSHNSTAQYAPFFLGACWYGAPLFRFLTERYLLTLALSVPVYLLLYVAFEPESAYATGALRLVLSFTGLLVGAAASVVVTSIPLLKPTFRYLGRNTLQIFVAHDMAISLLAASLLLIARDLPMVGLWAPVAVTLAAVALTLLLKLVLERLDVHWSYRLPADIGRRIARPRLAPAPLAPGE